MIMVSPSRMRHLVQRFRWSLSSAPPSASGEQWLLGFLSAGEADLYRAMSAQDRRHAVDCGRRVEDLGPEAIVASALHDVGKTEAGLGTMGRVGATLLSPVVRSAHPGFFGRAAVYKQHPERGAALLAATGSAPLAVAWAAEHHEPKAKWSPVIDPEVGRRLLAADDDVHD